MTLASLLPALDRFLEAAAISRMDAALAPIERKAERRLSAAFTLQGRVFLEGLAQSRRYFAEADPPPGWEQAAAQAEVVTQHLMTDALREVSEDALLAGLTDAAVAHGLIPPGTRPFGVGAPSMPPHVAGLFNLSNPRAVTYMEQHGGALVAGINDTTRAQLRTLLTDAISNGWSYDRTAREIKAKFAGFAGKASQGYIRSRAHLVAVTESASAYVQGNMMVARNLSDMGLDMEKSWLATGGACPICESNASQGWIGIDDVFLEGDDAPPNHPGCVLADTRVTAEGVSAASKRWYDGDFIIIRTASGKNLTCTPNHPILTPNGWVAAGLLNEGSRVISRSVSEWMALRSDLDNEDMPPRIEDIAEAIAGTEEVTTAPVPVSPEDFHGDGGGSKVAVIWANRLLRDSFNPTFGQHLAQSDLSLRSVKLLSLDSERVFADGIEVWAMSIGMCSRHLRGALLSRHARPSQRLSLGLGANADSRFKQAECDGFARNSVLLGQRENAGARSIFDRDYLNGERDPGFWLSGGSASHNRYPSLSQTINNRRITDTDLARDILDGAAGSIFADEVTNVERQRFKAHVYNLETRDGWYVANGIITHNCRCDILTQKVQQ